MKRNDRAKLGIVVVAACLGLAAITQAQPTPAPAPSSARSDRPEPGERGPQGPIVLSPEVRADRKVVFRLRAPQAESVKLRATDLPTGGGPQMTKGENGVWEVTVGPWNREPIAIRLRSTV
jgi:hypothetical protein